MPLSDAERWDARYRQDPRFDSYEQARPFLVEHARWLPTRGLAIDMAMGLGGNAGFLLARGLHVVGVDISWVALQRAKARLPGLMAVQADLPHFHLPENTFCLITNFFYLERSLWPAYTAALRPGGLLMIETLTLAMREVRPEIEPNFLLAPGELQAAFPELEILAYGEGWTESHAGYPRATAALLARKPETKEKP